MSDHPLCDAEQCLDDRDLNTWTDFARELEVRLAQRTAEVETLRVALGDMVRLYSPTAFPSTYHRAEQALRPTHD